MSRSLPAAVVDLVAQRVLAEIPMVRITVVEDHSVPTLDTPVTLTTWPTDRVNALGPEMPFLNRISYPIETFAHLPSPRGGSTNSLRRQVAFTLVNAAYSGGSLYDLLTANGRLDRAQVLLETLIVPTREMTGAEAGFQNGIAGLLTDGDTIEVFEGEISRVLTVGSEIQCQARSALPEVDWKLVPDDGSDPRDRGTRLPMPLGEGAIVRCVNLDVGAVATTAAAVAIADTSIPLGVEDIGTLPSSGSGMLGAEAISWTGRSGNILTPVTRGELGTAVANHIAGTRLIELQPIVLGVAATASTAVTALFVISETTGGLIRLPDLIYSIDYDDETTAPGSSGDGIVTATLSAGQVAVVVNGVVADATVTTQAEYADSGDPTVATDIDDTITADNALTAGPGSGATGSWTDTTTTPTWTHSGGGDQQELRTAFTDNLTGTAAALLRDARFGFDITVNTLSGSTITVGLRVAGAEAALIGVPDGTIVATFEATTTGAVTDIWGPVFEAAADGTVGDLYGVTLDVANGEVSGGGPSVAFTIDDTRIEVSYYSDSVISIEDNTTFNPGEEGGTTSSVGSPYWNADWDPPSRDVVRDDALDRLEFDWEVLEDTQIGTEFEGASLEDDASFPKLGASWNGIGANSSINVDVEIEATGDWSGISDKPPILTISGAADSTFETGSHILTNVRRNITSAAFVGVGFTYRVKGGADGDELTINTGLRAKYVVADPAFGLATRVEDAQIQASAGGIGLEFFAIVDGPEAPNANYNAASGDLMNTPADLIHYWLAEFGGFADADIDHAGTFTDADTDLAGYEWGFDARNLGRDWASILLRMGYEARSNICRPSGGDWVMLQASASGAFPAPTVTVDSIGDEQAIGKDDDEIKTRLTVFFAFDPRFESADSQSFTQVQTTDPLAAAVITREEEFGRQDADAMFLFCHVAAAGVTDWREYMEQELGRFAFIVDCRVDHHQAYSLEIGDVVTLATTHVGSIKARVIELQRNQDRGWLAKLVEVL